MGLYIFESPKVPVFSIYILICYSERKQISQYACPEQRKCAVNWQTFKFSYQSLVGKSRKVTIAIMFEILAKLIIIF